MAETSIEWTDRTWNPTRGCSVVSAGCHNCYAMKQAHRFNGEGMPYEGLTKMTRSGPQWTGIVRLVPEKLDEPLSWRKPSRVFVNSMSDLFHESLSDADIARVFDVMIVSALKAKHPRRIGAHAFQILTKRPARMRDWFASESASGLREIAADCGLATDGVAIPWPLPNVWLGVSAEDQRAADERIPLLLDTPAAVRFVSAEPLLGPVDLRRVLVDSGAGISTYRDALAGHSHGAAWHEFLGDDDRAPLYAGHERIDWVIVGGESGPHARPCDVQWIRDIRDQCRAAQVACFVKQLGARVHGLRCECGASPTPPGCFEYGTVLAHHRDHDSHPLPCGPVTPAQDHVRDPKGGDMSEWSEDLRVREFPNV